MMAAQTEPKAKTDYSKSCVYEITCQVTKLQYVGSTWNMKKRWSQHKNQYAKLSHQTQKLAKSFLEHGFENHAYTILEEVCCETRAQLCVFEGKWQRQLDTIQNGLNILEEGLSLDEKQIKKKLQQKAYNQTECRQASFNINNHTEKCKEQKRAHKQTEKCKQKEKAWREKPENKIEQLEANRKFRAK